MAKLTDKQTAFVREYLRDFNATQAAIRAGYSENGAGQAGHRLLMDVDIQRCLAAALEKVSKKAEVDAEYVLTRLKENVERSMQAEPVRDREGNETGEYTYQGAVANKALELLGKRLGLWLDRQEHSGPDGAPVPIKLVDKDEATAALVAELDAEDE